MRLADLMDKPAATRWGRWSLTDDGAALVIVDGTMPRYVPMDECKTNFMRWFWVRHYAAKGWIAPHDVADLVAALADLAER